MTQHTSTATASTARHHTCDPADRVTKSLLGYGVIAGPCYVVVSLAQALTRPGFDLSRHEWSLLANGERGWMQVANLVVTGLMVIAFAVGLRRALATGTGARWAPRLVAVYGVSLVAAGLLRADPALGFPAGTPAGPGPVSWHGAAHFVAGGIGFSCLAITCFVLAHRYTAQRYSAQRYSAQRRRGWARFSWLTGVVFLAGFAMVASGAGGPVANLAFTAAVILIWVWITAVAADRYGRVSRPVTAGIAAQTTPR
jgi:hypothetical membrane protein